MEPRLDIDRLAVWVRENAGLNKFAARAGIDKGTLSKDLRHQHAMSGETSDKVLEALQSYGIDASLFLVEPEDTVPAAAAVGSKEAFSAAEQLKVLDSLRPLDALPKLRQLEGAHAAVTPTLAARIAQSRPWKLSALADFDAVISEVRRIKDMYATSMSTETAIEIERMEGVARAARGEFNEAGRAFRRLLYLRDGSTWPEYVPPIEHFIAKNYAREAARLVERDRRSSRVAYAHAVDFFELSDSRTSRDPHDPRTGWNDLHRARLFIEASEIAPKIDRDRAPKLLESAKARLDGDGVGAVLVRLEFLALRASDEGLDEPTVRETRAVTSELIRHEHLTGAAASLALLAWVHARIGTIEAARVALEEAAAAYCLVPYEWFWVRLRETLDMLWRRFGSSNDYRSYVTQLRMKAEDGTGEFWVMDVKRLDQSRRETLVANVFADIARQRRTTSVATGNRD